MLSSVTQSFPPGFAASSMARTYLLGSVVGGVPPSLIIAPGAGEEKQRLFVRPSASLTL